MLLLSLVRIRALKAIVGLVPLAVGGVLLVAGLGDPTDPENLVLLGIGGVLVATGGHQSLTAIVGTDRAAEEG